MVPDAWKVAGVYSVVIEAQLAQSLLRGHGIEAEIFDENISRMIPLAPAFACRLMVRASQFDEAKKLLASTEQEMPKEVSRAGKKNRTALTVVKFILLPVAFFFVMQILYFFLHSRGS